MDTMNLHDLFSIFSFRVPDYQRGFSWEEKQLMDLWDDITNLKTNKETNRFQIHYTGTLFLEADRASSTNELYPRKIMNIVDGQQRLTALSILIFVLLKKANEGPSKEVMRESCDVLKRIFICKNENDEDSYKFCYAKGNINREFLLFEIFENRKTDISSFRGNIYSENLKRAKDYFAKKVEDLSDPELDCLFCKIAYCLQFDIREIDGNYSVQAIFETLNNRGKPLSVLEKLKNRLIYLSQNSPMDAKKTKEEIDSSFKCIYENLGKYRELDEDEMLSDFISVYRKPLNYVFSKEGAEKKVFQMFCNNSMQYPLDEVAELSEMQIKEKREPAADSNKIVDFVNELKSFCQFWVEFFCPNDTEILRLRALSSEKAVRILITVIKEKEFSNEEYILSLIEKIMFRNSVPGAYFFNHQYFATIARWLFNGKSDNREEKNYGCQNLVQDLEGEVEKEISPQNVVSQFKYLFTYNRGPKGFHRWWGLKYFLFEYQDYLWQQNKESKVIGWEDFYYASIEHIMPQTSETNWSDLLEELRAHSIKENPSVSYPVVVINSLGNLAILPSDRNSQISNKSWKEKREEYEKDGFVMEKEISSYSDWNQQSIYERGHKMILFLEKKLGTAKKLFTEKNIREILFYENEAE